MDLNALRAYGYPYRGTHLNIFRSVPLRESIAPSGAGYACGGQEEVAGYACGGQEEVAGYACGGQEEVAGYAYG